MPTIEQIRAARALLGWSQGELAEKSGLTQTSIARLENNTNKPNSATLDKITTALHNAGIEFIDNTGLRKRSGEIKIFQGVDGFRDFMDDVYEHVSTIGGDVCLYNAKPDNWLELLGEDWMEMHLHRMLQHSKNFTFRATCNKNDLHLHGYKYGEYRWVPDKLYKKHTIYIYGECLAIILFLENDVVINAVYNKEFSESLKTVFDVIWETVAQKIS